MNGYITKPFQVDVLQKAANEVLGINTEGAGGDPWYDERT